MSTETIAAAARRGMPAPDAVLAKATLAAAQHRTATRKLVESDAEQHVLESLLEATKPPAPEVHRLHYLLSTPFRYPPLPRGSRFESRWAPGVWYGSDALPTALAEVAYYR